MSIKVEITGELNEEEILKQLSHFGWVHVSEHNKTFFVLNRRIEVNGRFKDVESFQIDYSFSSNCAIFQSGKTPVGVNLRTGYTVYRVLVGKIVSDLIRNDGLKIKTYNISFE